jgi:hypothetical protein
VTDKKKTSSRLGAPPADWLSQSDVVVRGSAETQKFTRLGGPPREFGDASADRRRSGGPLTVLVVSEDRDSAARLAISFAAARLSIRLALAIDDVPPLLDGSTVVFAVVPRANHPIVRALANWGEGRVVYALAADRETADRVRGHCDVTLEAPWDIEKALATLTK